MSAYDISELVRRWATEQLTTEQVIGQMLLHVRDLVQRVERLERQQRRGAPPRGPSDFNECAVRCEVGHGSGPAGSQTD